MPRRSKPALAFPSILGLAVLIPAFEAGAAERMFAVVHVERAMSATQHWKDAVAHLEKRRAEMQTVLEAKQADIRQRKEKLDAKKAVAAPDAVVADEETLYRDAQLLTQQFVESQQQLSMEEKRLTDQMLTRMEIVVRELALEVEATFVFDRGTEMAPNVLYADPSIDITDRVMAAYAQRFKDKPLEIPATKK